jgi:CubicO group peptidase (beta-lactamase class C family)
VRSSRSPDPLVTILVYLLAQRGALSLDDPVAKHQPDTGSKEPITVRHLRHCAGAPTAGRSPLNDSPAMGNWERSDRDAERVRPRWEPGAVAGYHTNACGFIPGEPVRLVAGISVPEFPGRELLNLPGMHDSGYDSLSVCRKGVVPCAYRFFELGRGLGRL